MRKSFNLSWSSGVMPLEKGSESIFFSDALEGVDAHTVYGYVVHDASSGRNVTLSYPSDGTGTIRTGRAFHHGRFIMGLRDQARKYGYVYQRVLRRDDYTVK